MPVNDTEKSIVQAIPADVGCLVDGWLGQYAGAAMILVATSYGYDNVYTVDMARRHYESLGNRSEPGLNDDDDDERERLSWAVDDVETWLNDTVAADGYAFGWYDGDFFYQPMPWWDEVSQ